MLGEEFAYDEFQEDVKCVLDHGMLEMVKGALVPANPMYAETIARYLTRDDQDDMLSTVPDTPWATDDGLDMQGLLLAFQDFWRENAQMNRAPFEYNEAYPHIVLQAFLQRVLNGGGEIIREMALGKGALDLGVLFKGRKYAVEVKLRYLWDKNPDKALSQVRGYVDRLGVDEGWLVVFDPDMAKPWDEKISHEDRTVDGKPIHVFYC
jgi:hypothetical protein